MNKQPHLGDKVWLIGYGYIDGEFDFGIVQDEVTNTKSTHVYLKNQTRPYLSSELFKTEAQCRNWYRNGGVQPNNKHLKRGQRVWFFYHKRNAFKTPRYEDIYVDSGIVTDIRHSTVYIKGKIRGMVIDTVYTSERECSKEMHKVLKSGDFRIRVSN